MAKKKITNGDKIRQMTNEELIGFVYADRCNWCAYVYEGCKTHSCREGQTEYLNQEANI
jgi:hypothetical protein